MSVDLSALDLPYAITQVLVKLLQKNPNRDLVIKKMDAQLRSLRLLADRDREVDLEAAVELHSVLLRLLRDTVDRDEDSQRLALLACQYYYLKQDVVPDVGHGTGMDDDMMVVNAIRKALDFQ